MPARWIDFKALKEQVPIRRVLDRYGFTGELREKGTNKLVGACPIHHGKNPNSFHVDLTKNAFNCFSGCGGGNVLDLVAKVEQVSVREAAEKIATWFDLKFDRPAKDGNSAKVSEKTEAKVDSAKVDAKASEPTAAVRQGEQRPNPPLQRPLTLDQDHPYLWQRGLTVPTVKAFGLGFCRAGIMRGRIAVPIFDAEGELVAYAGRAVDEELAKQKGTWKLPLGFHKSEVLFNLNRAKEHAGNGLVCVEGFVDAMKVHQAGYPNVVALMGSALSEHQEQLLLAHTDRLALMFDGDEAGTKCLREFYGKLRRKMYLKEIHLEPGEQPDSLAEDRIRALLG